MKSFRFRSAITGVFLFLIVSVAAAQLPEPSVDIKLGLDARKKLLEDHHIITSTSSARTADNVFSQLLMTSPAKWPGLPFNWDVAVLSGDEFNAFSTSGGQVYVGSGLADLMGTKEALWAAVLGHELAHTNLRHHTAIYMRQMELQAEFEKEQAELEESEAMGDESAQMGLFFLLINRVVGELVNLNLSREAEHEADQVGMLMMAEAGYHPAYVFALHHNLRSVLGDKSHFRAFFSSHPRWETREQRSHEFYQHALARFESHWPNAALSPGGVPPPIVFLGKPKKSRVKDEGLAVISIPMQMEETAGQELRAYALLMRKGKRITTDLSEYRDRNGMFFASQPVGAPGGGHYLACDSGATKVEVLEAPGASVVTTVRCGEGVTLLGRRTRVVGGPGPWGIGGIRTEDWTKIQAENEEEGYVSASVIATTPASHSSQLEFRLPTAALPGKDRKLKSRVCVTADDGLVLDCTKKFTVKFPKVKKKR
jgi:hypothetical protein